MESQREFKANCRLASQIIASNRQYLNKSEEERNQILQKRLRKFYGSQHIDVAEEHFTSRIEPVYEEGVETSNDTLILFGTDFLGMQAMKKMFSPKAGSFKEIYLNPSNIMLQYSSPAEANEVIIKNLKPDSQTRFKIEEDTEQVRRFPKTPKEWIELNPYIYRFYYKGEIANPDCYRDYPRKVLVRYATTRERQLGKASFSHIEQLYERCKKIWTVQAHKHALLKEIIHRKLTQFKKKKDEMTKDYNKIVDEQGNDRERSRDKDKGRNTKVDLDKSIVICSEGQQAHNRERGDSNRNEDLEKSIVAYCEEEDRAEERIGRGDADSATSELKGLINAIEDININFQRISSQSAEHRLMEEGEGGGKEDVEGILKELNKLSFNGLRAEFIQLPYKTAVPSEMRGEKDPNFKFKYDSYLQKTEMMEQRMKKYCEIDLTDD